MCEERHGQVLPDALAPAPAGAWDDYTTWTGSVLARDGRWWRFYTGTSHREDGKPGVFGHLEIPRLEQVGDGWWVLFAAGRPQRPGRHPVT